MKDLFILRHAEAVLPGAQMEDRERPLTARGSAAAAQLGLHWQAQGLRFDKVVASPAVRTAQTAYAATGPLGYAPHAVSLIEPLYEGSVEVVSELLHAWNNSWERVLLVSHQPVIYALIAYLTGQPAPKLGPGGYVHLQLALDWWRGMAPGVGTIIS